MQLFENTDENRKSEFSVFANMFLWLYNSAAFFKFKRLCISYGLWDGEQDKGEHPVRYDIDT